MKGDFMDHSCESCEEKGRENRRVCCEGIIEIREGIRDIREGLDDCCEGLKDIRKCQVREGVDDLHEGICDIKEGINEIFKGLKELHVSKECKEDECNEMCEVNRDIRQIFEGLEDIEDGINDVEQKNSCGCEHPHVCLRGEALEREKRIHEKEERRFCEGIKDIQEGIQDIQMGFNDLVDDLKEIFFIADDSQKYSVHCGAVNSCKIENNCIRTSCRN